MTQQEELLTKEVAELKLQLLRMTQRYEMRNRDCNQRAEDRSKIAQQLYDHGLFLDGQNNVLEILE